METMETMETEITIRVAENHMTDDILVFIPPVMWDAENLAETIKRAITMALAKMPDYLDG